MNDSLERIISESGNVFGIACSTTALVDEACRRHDVGPTAAAALGRALTGALLLAALLKDDQSIQLIFEGNGPLGKVFTEAGSSGWARGYVASPRAELPLKDGMLDVAGGIGRAGFLRVIKDIGMEKKYTGLVQLCTSEIGEDIAYYLNESEQTPSAIGLGVHLQLDGKVAAAGGFLIQSLPPADEEIIRQLEDKIAALDPVTIQLNDGKTPGQILSHLFSSIPHKHTSRYQLSFKCHCSRLKMKKALHSLSEDDINYLIEHNEEIDTKCDFCNEHYIFTKKEIAAIAQTRKMH
jgi:molecular chaperone Hsp33